MTAVLHITKGKLDLRSITTFGLNSKPNTSNPIGYFGTGLKYAIAVLLRNKIPIEIIIDGRLWTFEVAPSDFRGKKVEEIFLVRHKKLLPSTTIKLPFTTDLGKNWKLWQAFREIHSNTLDEKGSSVIFDPSSDSSLLYRPNHTTILVKSQEYVEEYLSRDKTFLPEGLSMRTGSDSIQVFDAPSEHVYYRGIRIMDLKEEERSTLTYNILSSLELTEDRTVKDEWDVRYRIQNYLASTESKEIVSKAITAPEQSFERRLSFSYAPKSATFMEVVTEQKNAENLHPDAKSIAIVEERKKTLESSGHWIDRLISAIESEDSTRITTIIYARSFEVRKALEQYKEADEARMKETEDDISF